MSDRGRLVRVVPTAVIGHAHSITSSARGARDTAQTTAHRGMAVWGGGTEFRGRECNRLFCTPHVAFGITRHRGFDLKREATHDDARAVADFLNQNIVAITLT
jgi:hypothetical protein